MSDLSRVWPAKCFEFKLGHRRLLGITLHGELQDSEGLGQGIAMVNDWVKGFPAAVNGLYTTLEDSAVPNPGTAHVGS